MAVLCAVKYLIDWLRLGLLQPLTNLLRVLGRVIFMDGAHLQRQVLARASASPEVLYPLPGLIVSPACYSVGSRSGLCRAPSMMVRLRPALLA
jgi:hypothetical protein